MTQGVEARRMNDQIESGFGKIVHAVERGRRSQEAQLVAAAGQQPIDKVGIHAVRRKDRLGNTLRGVLIEV